MKKSTFKIVLMAVLAIGFTLTSCGNKSSKINKQGKEYTSAYVCPMYCPGSGGDEMGPCSVCGMDMVKNKNHKMEESHEGHNHDAGKVETQFACPMHPEITGVDGDTCSICGMDLKNIKEESHEGHNH